jgi:uncharacterized protein (TIGR00297 family)
MPDSVEGSAVRFGLGLLISGAIGVLAYHRDALSKSGVLGAVLVGTSIFGFGGWVWGVLLIVFFLSSSLLSKYKSAAKARLAEKFSKGHRRDLGQTLANGGVGAGIALAFFLYPDPRLLAAFVGAMAAVNADTWATELGVLSRRFPRLVTTWKEVEPGTSGGVSWTGTLAALAGSLVIGLFVFLLLALDGIFKGSASTLLELGGWLDGVRFVPSAILGGLAGSFFDSLLGATVQTIYYSSARQKETEKRVENDGAPNVYLRGWPWLGNDHVNLASSCVGALVGAVTWWLM